MNHKALFYVAPLFWSHVVVLCCVLLVLVVCCFCVQGGIKKTGMLESFYLQLKKKYDSDTSQIEKGTCPWLPIPRVLCCGKRDTCNSPVAYTCSHGLWYCARCHDPNTQPCVCANLPGEDYKPQQRIVICFYHFGGEDIPFDTFNLLSNKLLCPSGLKAVTLENETNAMDIIVKRTKELWDAANVLRLWLHISGHTDPDKSHDLPPWCVGNGCISMIDFVERVSQITTCCKNWTGCKESEILISMFGCELTRVSNNGQSCKELFLSIPQSANQL